MDGTGPNVCTLQDDSSHPDQTHAVKGCGPDNLVWLQMVAQWMLERLEHSQSSSITLKVEVQPSLFQEMQLPDSSTSVGHYQPSCLHAWALFLRLGHSRCVSKSGEFPEILFTYSDESHWRKFMEYCASKNLNVCDVRSHHYSQYMMHLFDEGYQSGRIIFHRTIAYDPAMDPQIQLLLQILGLVRSRSTNERPW